MTGKECYEAALALLGETTDSAGYYDKFALFHLNQVLANCRRELSALSTAAGGPEIAAPPRLSALPDALPAPEALARECFPYGLAALLVCDDDKLKFNWCAAEFADRLQRYCPASLVPMEEMD